MASKKAPKRGASRYQAPPPRKPLPGWAWLACGLVIGAFGFFLFSLEPGGDEIRRPVEARDKPAPASASRPADSATPKPKYDFYTLLPETEVILPPGAETSEPAPPAPTKPETQAAVTPEEAARIDAARAEAALKGEVPPPPPVVASAAPAAPTAKTQFFLQAGSFRRAEEADRVRAQILMLGHEVRVETGEVKGETWHRVLVGPYPDQPRMTQVQKQLAGSGYANLLPQKRQVR